MGLRKKRCLYNELRNWNHYTYVFDGTNNQIRYYINGQSIGVSNTSRNYSREYPFFALGSYASTGAHPGHGQQSYFDDLRIYKRALSASEVTGIYNKTDALSSPGDATFDLSDTVDAMIGEASGLIALKPT